MITGGKVDCVGGTIATVLNRASELETGTVASGPMVTGVPTIAQICAMAEKVSRRRKQKKLSGFNISGEAVYSIMMCVWTHFPVL